jgi:hypothetical protein
MQISRMLLAFAASAALFTVAPATAEPPHGNQNWQNNQGHGNNQGQQGQHGNQGQQGQHGNQGGNYQGAGPHGPGPVPAIMGQQMGHGGHDRYWRNDFGNRGFIGRDRIFFELRRHNFNRFVGDPYWFQGRFVVKTYDRFGHVVFVEVNPYTGAYIGVVRF